MHAYTIQQLIRIILFITISLPIGLKSFAQETKRFYMELDTPRNGAKAGQGKRFSKNGTTCEDGKDKGDSRSMPTSFYTDLG